MRSFRDWWRRWRQRRRAQAVSVGGLRLKFKLQAVPKGFDADALTDDLSLFLFHTLMTGRTPAWSVQGNAEPPAALGELSAALTAARPSSPTRTLAERGEPAPSGWEPPGSDRPHLRLDPSDPKGYDWEPGFCLALGERRSETRECLLPGPGGHVVVRLSRDALKADVKLFHAVRIAEREWRERGAAAFGAWAADVEDGAELLN